MNTVATTQGTLAPGLRDALAQIKQAVRAEIGPDFRLILYGSYARGEQTDESDVDLMLVLPDKVATFSTTNRLRDLIYDFSLRTTYLFSVLVVTESVFREQAGFLVFASIEREGMVV